MNGANYLKFGQNTSTQSANARLVVDNSNLSIVTTGFQGRVDVVPPVSQRWGATLR